MIVHKKERLNMTGKEGGGVLNMTGREDEADQD
jgi:hypothetical protein